MGKGSAFLTFFLMTAPSPSVTDEGVDLPLWKKAEIFERNVLEKHWIDGLYPSSVEIPLDGGPVDHTTSGSSNVAHSINWTSYYLAGQCHRYLLTRDEGVREHCSRIFRALLRLQQMTGIRGLMARGYLLGHGESYEEREGSPNSKYWHQGVPPFQDYRWRGHPSHHSYSSAAHAFGLYYELMAEGEEKDLCRDALDALVSYWLDNDMIIWDEYHEDPTPILGLTDGKTPNTRILMAVSALLIAFHATGKEKFEEAREKLIAQYGLRSYRGPIQGEEDFDDTNHLFHHLEVVMRIEKDPEMRQFWRHVAERLWQAHKDDRQSLWTYIYFGLFPDAPGKEKALSEALWTLQTYPTKRIFRPRMNSIRKDIEIVNGRSAKPLPMYESPWDNEYQWKGNLYQLDGWLSRPVISVAVSGEDPMVIYAADSRGDIYQSRDGAKSWKLISLNLPAKAIHLASGRYSRVLFVAADNGFYKTTTAGSNWERLPLPDGSGNPKEIVVDRINPNVLYAITDKGIYRSLDLGEEWIGARWECLTSDLPNVQGIIFAVGLGDPTMLYAVVGNKVWSKRAEGGKWEKGGDFGIPQYAPALPWLLTDPKDPKRLYSAYRVSYEGRQILKGTVVSISSDCGKRFSNDLKAIYEKFSRGGLEALIREVIPHEILSIAVDPSRPNTIYAAVPEGVLRRKGDGNWEVKNEGLPIPRAYKVFAPINTSTIYLSTPAGLFYSHDGGDSWQDANLCLIFEGNSRREVGSADFLDAYWRGRFFGFIRPED